MPPLDDDSSKYLIVGGFGLLAVGAFFAFRRDDPPPHIGMIDPSTYVWVNRGAVTLTGSAFKLGSSLIFTVRGFVYNIPAGAIAVLSESTIMIPTSALNLPAGADQLPLDIGIQVRNLNGISNSMSLHVI